VDGDARQIVWESGAKACTELDNAGFGESRMDSVGRGQQFESGAHAHAIVLALDRCRAEHEAVFVTRDDVERPARMEQAYRTRQLHFVRLDDDHFTFDAAKLWEPVACA